MSWNAAKRAISLSYGNVHWFPDGTEGWQEAGGELEPGTPVEPVP
jgi:rhodanese-related sulfurtransferase